jgi:hypothetical protein
MLKLKMLATAAVLVAGSAAQAANVMLGFDNIHRPVIVLDGEIVAGDADRVAALLRPDLAGIRLNSPGGIVYEGARIADLVRGISLITPPSRMAAGGAVRCASDYQTGAIA